MLRFAPPLAALALLAGCELVAGISDKTLVSTGVGVPCSRQPTYQFCDDFDSEPSFGQTWDWHTTQSGGTYGFDTTDYATPSRSARFSGPSTAVSTAQLGKNDVTLPDELRLAFDLRLDVSDASTLPQVAVAQVLTSTSVLSINYVLGPGAQATLQVFDNAGGNGPVTTVKLPMPPLRAWTNLVLTTDWKTIALEEDGKSVASTAAPVTGAPGPVKLIVGVVYVNPSQGAQTATLELDDVVIGGH